MTNELLEMVVFCKYNPYYTHIEFFHLLKEKVHVEDIFLHVNIRGKIHDKLIMHITHRSIKQVSDLHG